jgi:hypothetical protein
VLQQNEKIWQAEHDGYKRLADPVKHKRTVFSLDGDRWLVVDHLNGTKTHHYALHWLLNDFPFEQGENSVLLSVDSMQYRVQAGLVKGKSVFSLVGGDPNSTRGWRSRYYGEKEPALSAMLETIQPRACFWTFFGFEQDVIELAGNELKIRLDSSQTSIDLAE